MKYETIKVGNKIYNIAKGSCSLNDFSGFTSKVAIIIGSNEVTDIHKNLSENTTVTKYDADGVEEWKQDNLVYTGQMSLQSSFPIGIEPVEETDENGNTVTRYKEAMGEVVIVEYRTPDIQDELKSQKKQITSLNAQLAYLQMISGVETEVDHE